MSLHDDNPAPLPLVQEEVALCLSKTFTDMLGQLPPLAQLRLLAFMHLVDSPETLKASLEIHPSGSLRLTLDALVTPCRHHQH